MTSTSMTFRLRSDAQLLRRFRAGDDRAFDVLHGRHADPIRRYVRGMLRGTPHDAEDATQDVFLRAFEALRRDGRPVEVRPWLFRVAHNRCLDLRRRAPSGALPEVLVAPATDEPAEVTETRDALRALLRDIGRLPDRQRSALLLREVGGLSHEAVADALEVSVGASKQLVARARVTLAEAATARDAVCSDVRERLALAADAGHKPDRVDRAHVKHCLECRVCAARLERVDRNLSLIPAGGAGLLGLLATKTAVTAACAVVCVGGATAVVEPGLVPWPPAGRPEQRASTPRPKPERRAATPRRATAPAKAGVAAAAAPVAVSLPAPKAQPVPQPARKRAHVSEVAAVVSPSTVQTPEPAVPAPAPSPAPVKPKPSAPAEPAPVQRETIDLADLEG